MTYVQALTLVASGRCERVAVPGLFRVFRENGRLVLEIFAR